MKPLEIKGARARLGFTQQFMAEQLGISVASYSCKERGEIKFSDSEKVKIAEMFQWTLVEMNEYLYDGQLPLGNAKTP